MLIELSSRAAHRPEPQSTWARDSDPAGFAPATCRHRRSQPYPPQRHRQPRNPLSRGRGALRGSPPRSFRGPTSPERHLPYPDNAGLSIPFACLDRYAGVGRGHNSIIVNAGPTGNHTSTHSCNPHLHARPHSGILKGFREKKLSAPVLPPVCRRVRPGVRPRGSTGYADSNMGLSEAY